MRPRRFVLTLIPLLASGLFACGSAAGRTIPPDLAKKLAEARAKKDAKTSPTSRPAGTATKSPARGPDDSRYGKLHRILKFTPAKPEQIRAFRKRAHDWAKQTRKTITKDLRLVETTHFLIFTTWDPREHRALGSRCEAMYRALCRQFDIPTTRNIWAGKLPIFMFWEKKHFDAFTTKIDKVRAVRAGGYNVQKGDGFTYLVVSHTETKTRFYEVLIHESTHAFLGRYLTNRVVPRWVNEGLAEYMAGKLVKNSLASQRHAMAARLAVLRNVDVSGVFSGKHLSPFGYGIAQSLVRYLAASNRKGFIRFLQLMKEGKSEKDALQEALKLTHAELVRKWREWARKTHQAPRPVPIRRR